MLKCKILSLSRQGPLRRSWQKSLLKQQQRSDSSVFSQHVSTRHPCLFGAWQLRPCANHLCGARLPLKSKGTVLSWLSWAACAFENNTLPHYEGLWYNWRLFQAVPVRFCSTWSPVSNRGRGPRPLNEPTTGISWGYRKKTALSTH